MHISSHKEHVSVKDFFDLSCIWLHNFHFHGHDLHVPLSQVQELCTYLHIKVMHTFGVVIPIEHHAEPTAISVSSPKI